MTGSTSVETFPCRLTFGVFFRRFVPSLVIITVVTVLFFMLVLGLLGVDRLVAFLVGAVVAGLHAVVLVVGKKRQFDLTWGTSRLELSPTGAAIVSRYARVSLPWDRIRYLGTADLLMTRRSRGAGLDPGIELATTIAAGLSNATAATARRHGQPALIGDGTTTIDFGTPKLIRGQIHQNNGCRATDPRTGYRLTAIVLPIFDPTWSHSHIATWIKTYRPDLLTTE